MRKDKSNQKGTLLIEAIAMLGLIAMVTPTLYKKSAERLQEIQDINTASQVRMMNSIIEAFVNTNKGDFATEGEPKIYELLMDSAQSGIGGIEAFDKGYYSSFIPAGFTPNDIKNFGDPKVFVLSDAAAHSLVYYIIYPSKIDIGQRRTAKLASLVGSNGGFVQTAGTVSGVGGSWGIDSSIIKNYNLSNDFKNLLSTSSLVVTNTETISTMNQENDKYLWRVHEGDVSNAMHNTMITDLYLGGNTEQEADNIEAGRDYYSIFNVRKLTMNTTCSAYNVWNSSGSGAACQLRDQVADLYIGKPVGQFKESPSKPGSGKKQYGANTGAAWIYGNLSALSDRFKLYNTDSASVDRNGYDVLYFGREEVEGDGDTPGNPGAAVIEASTEQNKAQVKLINGHVRVVESFENSSTAGRDHLTPAFYVGGDSAGVDWNNRLIAAAHYRSGYKGYDDVVDINSVGASSLTQINPNGGAVYINGTTSSVAGETYINNGGGELYAGKDGQWMRAEGLDNSAKVVMLYDSNGNIGSSFSVAGETVNSSAIWVDSQVASIGKIRTYNRTIDNYNSGGFKAEVDYTNGFSNTPELFNNYSSLTDATVIASKYTDVLGSTYLGLKNTMSAIYSSEAGPGGYSREGWTLGVAGSAWVDELLFANEAWFNKSGFKELHAGFSSFADFNNDPRKGWLNAYKDGVSIGNKVAKGSDTEGEVGGIHAPDTRFFADSTQVYLGDASGSKAHMKDGVAMFGYDSTYSAPENFVNYVGADSTKAFVVGDNLVDIHTKNNSFDFEEPDDEVDIQNGAMMFKGHSRSNSSYDSHEYGNVIEAHANAFTIQTSERKIRYSDGSEENIIGPAAAEFWVHNGTVRVRYDDFIVEKDDGNDSTFVVRPNKDPDSGKDSANVMIDGSFHVTGNKVIHVASNSSNAVGMPGNDAAMFEIDPNYIRVRAMDGNNVDSSDTIFEINPRDTLGATSSEAYTNMATGENGVPSIYVRKGAIELMSDTDSSHSWTADEGYGYIKAGRLVDNRDIDVPFKGVDGSGVNKYDRYMVNPAYTSVMHDIKLTTRGGARLSDVLPDYVLKGVYIVANDYVEGKRERIKWSAGEHYCDPNHNHNIIGAVPCTDDKTRWADPYVGVVPYAACPLGYKNMATITPTSFQMAQAGEILISSSNAFGGMNYGTTKAPYVVNPTPRQANTLNNAGAGIAYPSYEQVKTVDIKNYQSSTGHINPTELQYEKIEGWYLGFDAPDLAEDSSNLPWTITMDNGIPVQKYGDTGLPIVVPLYFQQNTFLKTSLKAGAEGGLGWEARMGFLYDISSPHGYHNLRGNYEGIDGGIGIKTDDTDEYSGSYEQEGKWTWNLFPVPTNTIEGYAHVYCYFDRKEFLGENLDASGEFEKWKNVVEPLDQLNKDLHHDQANKNSNPEYIKRLNDPTLKYNDPW